MIVGQTFFKNTDFIYYAMNKGIVDTPTGVEYFAAHPPKLGQLLNEGKVDIAPTSSIIYGENPGDFEILPDFSISALGKTKSILVFSKELSSLEEAHGKKIAVPGTSASSSALLEIICGELGLDVEIVFNERPNLDQMLKKADAALLIGDQAIYQGYLGSPITDLGDEWHKLTGKMMVYALWVCRQESARDNYDGINSFYHALSKSRDYAYKNIEAISEDLASQIEVSKEFMHSHLKLLDYNLKEQNIEGLKTYFKMAKKYSIIDEMPKIKISKVDI